MKNTNNIALALTLAFASLAAQAQGMDIGINATRANSAPAGATPATNPHAMGTANPARPVTAQVAPEVKPRISPVAPVASPAVKHLAAPATVAAKAPSAPTTLAPRVTVAPAPAVTAAKPAAPLAASQPQALESETNPFTGKDLTTEQRQRQLENAKMDTDLIQEKLKQANLIADLTYLPLKKKAEVSTLPGVAKDAAFATSLGVAPERVVPKAVKKIKVSKKKPQAVPAPVAALPAPAVILVSGISINGTRASAILESEGGIMSAQNGEVTPFGLLRVIDSRTVSLGGRTLKVRDAMLSRMTVSDPVYVDPEKARSGPAIAAAQPQNNSNAMLTLPPLPPLPAPPKGMVSLAPTPGR